MYHMKIGIKQNEGWYGVRVNDGCMMPLTAQSGYTVDIDPNTDCNQCNTMLLSSRGRYIWCNSGFKINCRNSEIHISSEKEEPVLYEDGKTLKEAFLNAANRHFPPTKQVPPKAFFSSPQYNTWIELMYDQNQDAIVEYASNIPENGLPPGILMIDDGWADYYGHWDFNRNRFPDPAKMVDELHHMGFKVMLWICPFISPDSMESRTLQRDGLLVRDEKGAPAIKEWWNGYSAVLDLSNPGASAWLHGQLRKLMETYGIDGFKFDAGDGAFYSDRDCTYGAVSANEQSRLWAEFGTRYEYNEYRACFQTAGQPLVQRLADKRHSWGLDGLASLIPNALLQGSLGYVYSCPDMIGGGEFTSFLENSGDLDEELFVRYAQCAALMPMMQFSAAPWRILSPENAQLCVDAAKLHIQFSELIYDLARHSSETGEPIIRYMEYEFPGQGFLEVTDQFMLGRDILVAPVYAKGERVRDVLLPEGVWRYADGRQYTGGRVSVPAGLDVLPYFVKEG